MIQVKRVYDEPADSDGKRFLVDRLWPRGMKKESLRISAWVKNAAPSTELRQWFHRDRDQWDEFRRRYFAELAEHASGSEPLVRAAREGTITLLYSSKDTARNHALLLKEFIDEKIRLS